LRKAVGHDAFEVLASSNDGPIKLAQV
jgi:hypothetical protein